jgi:Protein NO VEIN, C-terminal
MKPIVKPGVALDAEFCIESSERGATLVLESRFGQARNPDYNPALALLLSRLRNLHACITDAIVDSTVSRALAFEERRLHLRDRSYPLRLDVEDDIENLRIAICAAQESVAQRPGARGGNRHKRIRLFLEAVEEEGLETLLAGGGAQPDSQVEEDKEAVDRLSGSRGSGGQGSGLDAAQRRAVELRAVAVVSNKFEDGGWSVEDVSAQKLGYDLHIERGQEERHVEVKGTVGSGTSVLLTANEVRHSRSHPAHTVLAVVRRIELSDKGGSWEATGGFLRCFNRWRLEDGALEPRSYEWVLPPEETRSAK